MSPTAIKEYNQNMQGVDRNDQVRARFSITDGHSFKKWYKKLGLAVIDIARVNAFLTRRLHRKDDGDERDSHRQFMIELIQEMITGRWQNAPSDDSMLFGEDDQVEDMRSPVEARVQTPLRASRPSPTELFSPSSPHLTCSGVDSSQMFEQSRRKRMCIVCRFEGRNDTMTTQYCVEHKVCLCRRVYPDAINAFGCQRTEWTCWEKFHKFYLPRNAFTVTGCVRRTSAIYKEKKLWMESAQADRADSGASPSQRQRDRSLSFSDVEQAQDVVSPGPSVITTNTPAPSFISFTGSVTPTPSFDFI